MDTEKLKSEIRGIIGGALSGVDEKYRFNQNGFNYIRWGRVTDDIDHCIDRHQQGSSAESQSARCICDKCGQPHSYKSSGKGGVCSR